MALNQFGDTSRRPRISYFLGAAILLLGLTRADATEANDDLADLELEQLMQMPVESVSGASKYEQSIRQAPASVTVLTAADIRNYGWRTVADALRSAPGFHIRNDRFYEYIGNRGFTTTYNYNARTMILVDGHRINDAIYQQGSVGTEFLLDPDLIDRIEIINGPGSSLYGSNAFNGAINIIPKKGRELAGGQAAVSVDSTPGGKSRVSLGNRTVGGVEYLVSATASNSQGEGNFALPQSWRDAMPLGSASKTAQTAPHNDGTTQQQIYARVSWRGFESEAAYGRREKDLLPTIYTTLLEPNSSGVDQRGYWLLRATGQPQPDATLTAQTSVDYYHFDGRYTINQSSTATPDFEPFQSSSNAISLNHEVRWHQTFVEGHSLLLGAEVQNNLEQTNQTTAFIPSNSRKVDVTSNYVSPFAQIDYALAPTLTLSTGARYDTYSTGESRLSPRAGLIWAATRSTTLKLLYGESFRVPNLEERYPTDASTVVNPNLKPETNRSWELSCDQQLSKAWTADVRLYHSASDNLITYTGPDNGPYTSSNAGSYVTQGAELGGSGHFDSGLQLRASTTLQSTESQSGHELGDAPEWLVKLNVSTPLGCDWLRASCELQYVGSRSSFGGFGTTPTRVDDYLVSNFTLRAAPVWHHWEISLSIYNLANARWMDSTNTQTISSPPRTAVLRLVRNF
jgi:outer membrane receptor protein involved in Fe transport